MNFDLTSKKFTINFSQDGQNFRNIDSRWLYRQAPVIQKIYRIQRQKIENYPPEDIRSWQSVTSHVSDSLHYQIFIETINFVAYPDKCKFYNPNSEVANFITQTEYAVFSGFVAAKNLMIKPARKFPWLFVTKASINTVNIFGENDRQYLACEIRHPKLYLPPVYNSLNYHLLRQSLLFENWIEVDTKNSSYEYLFYKASTVVENYSRINHMCFQLHNSNLATLGQAFTDQEFNVMTNQVVIQQYKYSLGNNLTVADLYFTGARNFLTSATDVEAYYWMPSFKPVSADFIQAGEGMNAPQRVLAFRRPDVVDLSSESQDWGLKLIDYRHTAGKHHVICEIRGPEVSSEF